MVERLAAVTERLAPIWEAARTRSFWIVLPLATLGVIGTAAVVGSTAMLRADAWRVRTNEIRATGETVEAWRQELVAPPPAESAAWERSRRAVRGLGIEDADRIALMQEVAQRAEDLGLATVSVAFMDADTLGIDVYREVDGLLFDPAPYALHMKVLAGYEGAASFIGSLPPQVEVHRLRMTREEGGGILTELILAVFVGGEG